MSDHRFPKSARLLRSCDFERVFQGKCVAADRWLVVYALPGLQAESRLGLVVSRKCGNAVVRNRWKRLLRESFRLERCNFGRNVDVVLLPRRNSQPELQPLQKSLRKLIIKLEPELAAIGGACRAGDSTQPG